MTFFKAEEIELQKDIFNFSKIKLKIKIIVETKNP